jgi:hypothetical protein
MKFLSTILKMVYFGRLYKFKLGARESFSLSNKKFINRVHFIYMVSHGHPLRFCQSLSRGGDTTDNGAY